MSTLKIVAGKIFPKNGRNISSARNRKSIKKIPLLTNLFRIRLCLGGLLGVTL